MPRKASPDMAGEDPSLVIMILSQTARIDWKYLYFELY